MKQLMQLLLLMILSINTIAQNRNATIIEVNNGDKKTITIIPNDNNQTKRSVQNKTSNDNRSNVNQTNNTEFSNKYNNSKTKANNGTKKAKLAPSECRYCERKMLYGQPFYYNLHGLDRYYSLHGNKYKNFLQIVKCTENMPEYSFYWEATLLTWPKDDNIFCSKICAINYCSALLNSY